MGIGLKNLHRLRDLGKLGLLASGNSIIELGAQELYCEGSEEQLADFIRYFSSRRNKNSTSLPATTEISRFANKGFSSELFKACGFKYQALDIFNGEDITLFDLNFDVPHPDFSGKFDLVTNFGTTEHVLNQYLAFKTMHELVKPGGIIYHDLPMGGYHLHGYFNYNPMLFEQLAAANNYEVLFYWYSSTVTANTAATPQMKDHGYPTDGWVDFGIEFVFRKSSDQPFRMPLDTTTSLGLDPTILSGKGDPYGRQDNEAITIFRGNEESKVIGSINRQSNFDGISALDLQREFFRRCWYRAKKLLSA